MAALRTPAGTGRPLHGRRHRLAEASGRLRDHVRRRFEYALEALVGGRPLYLHDGVPAL
ncbi:hypothetical protein [Streptomyces sp. NRRL F-5053]|uniref:hypothetical protein n=1 Tax=Streptomyces sp. NRRL F-5053 TaxID=1463854 RepID=UPI0019000BD4|nr:hypothetical protein [Streptomyces sp. NRRL F-5053]